MRKNALYFTLAAQCEEERWLRQYEGCGEFDVGGADVFRRSTRSLVMLD